MGTDNIIKKGKLNIELGKLLIGDEESRKSYNNRIL